MRCGSSSTSSSGSKPQDWRRSWSSIAATAGRWRKTIRGMRGESTRFALVPRWKFKESTGLLWLARPLPLVRCRYCCARLRHFLDDSVADLVALGVGDHVAAGVAERLQEGEVPPGETLRRVGRRDAVVEQAEH